MRGATSVSLPFEKDSDCDRPKSAIFTVILSRVGSFSETRIFDGLRSQWTIPAKEGGGQGMGVREDGGLEVAVDDTMVVQMAHRGDDLPREPRGLPLCEFGE